VALDHTNTGADQRNSWAWTPAPTRTTHGPLKGEYSKVWVSCIYEPHSVPWNLLSGGSIFLYAPNVRTLAKPVPDLQHCVSGQRSGGSGATVGQGLVVT
jgi:hypothetical protein